VKTFPSEPRWRVQYFYDESKSTFAIHDLSFMTPQRGVAVGSIVEGKHGHQEHVAMVTSDGGQQWQRVPLHDLPLSLYFLSESLGWMVGRNNLWRTTEAGKNWEKVKGFPDGMTVVHFVDEKYGLAAGTRKHVYETRDGGAHWTALPAAAEPPGEARYSAYTWIAFATPTLGIITGFNQPPRHFNGEQFPEWMDPDAAIRRRDTPHLSYTLVTPDGGKTWKSNSSSVFGRVTRVRFGPRGRGLGLIEYSNAFRYPSEVYSINWPSGQNSTVYSDRRFVVTDIWMAPGGTAYIAGVESAGEMRGVVPGKVRVMESHDSAYKVWTPMAVDYRAVANQVVLSGVDNDNLWLATDNGMILKLSR
jgi:hypothetical protein